jgi:hypothetical protein
MIAVAVHRERVATLDSRYCCCDSCVIWGRKVC